MTQRQAQIAVQLLQQSCDILFKTAETAGRNRQSLSGSNFYAEKFHCNLIEMAKAECSCSGLVEAYVSDEKTIESFRASLLSLKSFDASVPKRREAVKNVRLFCHSVLLPAIERMTANSVPQTEQVLPLSVLPEKPTYLKKVIDEANGCYEHQWYDACSVMIRRFIETLIILVYEAEKRTTYIKNGEEFLMLQGLIEKMLQDSAFNLGRETRKTLPLLKQVGDRSAHNRYYIATKSDLDKVIPGLRVLAEELLHLANLK